MTNTTTNDLALARAERDAWQTTCEELHHQIARLTVEIEAHLERIDAADQRARTLDAALTHEREAGRGLVAQVEALRAESRHHASIAAQNATISNERDAAIARAEKAEADRAATNQEIAKLHAVIKGKGFSVEGSVAFTEMRAEIAKLRAEVAELRARPALTVEALTGAVDASIALSRSEGGARKVAESIMAKLGPVALPGPDAAEEIVEKMQRYGWWCASNSGDGRCQADMRRALAALAKLSPAPAREAAPTDRVLVHADGGDCHGSRVVNGRCVKCGLAPDSQSTELWEPAKVDRIAADHAAAVKVEPTLVAVSDEELRDAYLNDPDDTLSGIRAVRAKLGAAEVTEERLAAALCEHFKYEGHRDWSADARAILAHLRATAAKGG